MNNYGGLIKVWFHPSLPHHCHVLPSHMVPELCDIPSWETSSSSSWHQGRPSRRHGFHEDTVIP